MNTINERYEKSLNKALNKLLNKYKNRLKKNPNCQHKHVSLEDANKISAAGATIGGIVGSVVPGAGNLIGAAAGAATGVFTAGCIEVNNRRQNKKIDNARIVKDFFGENQDFRDIRKILEKSAKQVIDERSELINNLEDTEKNKKAVVNYLAVNMMAAIKHNTAEAANHIYVIKEGLPECRSRKEASHALRNRDSTSTTLKKLAKYRGASKSEESISSGKEEKLIALNEHQNFFPKYASKPKKAKDGDRETPAMLRHLTMF